MNRIREQHPRKLLKQAIVIILIGVAVGLLVNLFSPNRISWVGVWKVAFDSTGIIKPEYFEEQDTLITIDEVIAMYQSRRTVFIDARMPEEFEEGHIKGALLLPFEEYDDYIGAILKKVPKDAAVITYCGEEDCDVSLYLARVLREDEGYEEVYTFYGGYEEWLKSGMPVASGFGGNYHQSTE